MRRRPSLAALGVALALALGVIGAVPRPTSAWSAGACPGSTGVTVIVDFSALGGDVEARCAPALPRTGLDALAEAGFTVTPLTTQPAFVCRIDGLPGPGDESCIDDPTRDRLLVVLDRTQGRGVALQPGRGRGVASGGRHGRGLELRDRQPTGAAERGSPADGGGNARAHAPRDTGHRPRLPLSAPRSHRPPVQRRSRRARRRRPRFRQRPPPRPPSARDSASARPTASESASSSPVTAEPAAAAPPASSTGEPSGAGPLGTLLGIAAVAAVGGAALVARRRSDAAGG